MWKNSLERKIEFYQKHKMQRKKVNAEKEMWNTRQKKLKSRRNKQNRQNANLMVAINPVMGSTVTHVIRI